MNAELLHIFHLQRVQLLLPEDYPARVRFTQCYLQQSVQDVNFSRYVLFSDEAIFDSDGVFSQRNAHLWTQENPYSVRHHAEKCRFMVNVWEDLVCDSLWVISFTIQHDHRKI